jgi:succinate dehydrogenase/fumarate reductase flavoprotein subunit
VPDGGVAADGALPWLPAEPEIAETDIEEEIDTEVIIIGLGVAGVSACRSAAEEGAKVVAIEKSSGPNARSSEYAVVGGEFNEQIGRMDADPDKLAEEYWKTMLCAPKLSIWKRWANEIGDVFSWWAHANENLYVAPRSFCELPDSALEDFEKSGCILSPNHFPAPELYNIDEEEYPVQNIAFDFAPLHKPQVLHNMSKATSAGAIAYYGHFAEKIIMDGKRVVGVYARNAETGKYKKTSCSKGIVLATGDYASNNEMRDFYTPELTANGVPSLWIDFDVEDNPTNTGDGHKMGAWINAAIQDHHAAQTHWMGAGQQGSKMGSGGSPANTSTNETLGFIGAAPYLQLNVLGKRFMNEDIPAEQIENQIELQPQRLILQIMDSNWPEQLPHFAMHHAVVCYYLEKDPGEMDNVNGPWMSKQKLEGIVESGGCFKADTLEELLDLFPEFDKTESLKSIERYNQLAKTGYDEDFGKRADRMFPLETGPFYAMSSGVTLCLTCMGGLESDEEARVYDNNREIIPGLYVAGNVQGNKFAYKYPIYPSMGAGHSTCMFYGYVAGKNVINGV